MIGSRRPGENVHTRYRIPWTMAMIKQTTRTIEFTFELSVCKIPSDWSHFEICIDSEGSFSILTDRVYGVWTIAKEKVLRDRNNKKNSRRQWKKKLKLVHGKQQINSVSSGTNGINFFPVRVWQTLAQRNGFFQYFGIATSSLCSSLQVALANW